MHHSKAATSELTFNMKSTSIALVQEPWTNKNKPLGLTPYLKAFYDNVSNQTPRTAIFGHSSLHITPLPHLTSHLENRVKKS
jgi:hypothetical protein